MATGQKVDPLSTVAPLQTQAGLPVRGISLKAARWGRFGAFTHRSYRLFCAASFISFCVVTIQLMTRAWMVQEMTHSPLLVAMVPALQVFPMLVLSFLGGELADRCSRKTIVILGEAGTLAGYLALAGLAMAGAIQVWHIMALTLLLGVAGSLALPARQSLIIDVVPKRDHRGALGMYMLVFNVSQIAAPALAGLMISRFGVDAALIVSALLFIPVVPILTRVRPLPVQAVARPRIGSVESLKVGVRYILGDGRLRWMFVALLVVVLGVNSWGAMFPTFTEDVLGRGAGGLGMIVLGVGVGSTVGTFVAMTLDGRATDKAIQIGSGLAFAIVVGLIAYTPSFAAWVILATVAACVGTVFFVHNMMAVQLNTPDDLRGRVIAARFVLSGLQPFGQLALGAMAEGAGPQMAMAVFAIASAVGLGAVVLVSRRTPGVVREPALP
jgi:MFS family permease